MEEHLCLHCPFMQEVWNLARAWSDDMVKVPLLGTNIEEWWSASLHNAICRRTNAKSLLHFSCIQGGISGRNGTEGFFRACLHLPCRCCSSSRKRLLRTGKPAEDRLYLSYHAIELSEFFLFIYYVIKPM